MKTYGETKQHKATIMSIPGHDDTCDTVWLVVTGAYRGGDLRTISQGDNRAECEEMAAYWNRQPVRS
jgi:hypothetical protein